MSKTKGINKLCTAVEKNKGHEQSSNRTKANVHSLKLKLGGPNFVFEESMPRSLPHGTLIDMTSVFCTQGHTMVRVIDEHLQHQCDVCDMVMSVREIFYKCETCKIRKMGNCEKCLPCSLWFHSHSMIQTFSTCFNKCSDAYIPNLVDSSNDILYIYQWKQENRA